MDFQSGNASRSQIWLFFAAINWGETQSPFTGGKNKLFRVLRSPANYVRTRYATLLWKNGIEKANAGYVSENEDPPRPKSEFTAPAQDYLVNVE
ncbi:hypothetical protein H5410_012656 [Solanum commersonii]|uniref:Uncharacterized protein n=1 Tax=Solanum commersonii TaxID=4109 RepID=A0A9J6ASA8_SOLCO|nr:hypothetical protein H5410_012656 [Solanum commersonii]